MSARWKMVGEALARPYRLPIPLVFVALLVPFYILIGESMPGRALHRPEIALDRALPLSPVWALVYGMLYAFVIILPIFVVRDFDLLRRTAFAYLTIWLTAYVVFIAWPTVAPRPAQVEGNGFVVWGLQFLYGADPPFNCFPSLHVAHSFVSAFACYRVHRGVGVSAGLAGSLIALSTLLTKQHYVLDVLAGIALAAIACFIFLRKPAEIAPIDREAAPLLALCVAGVVAAGLAAFAVAYSVQTAL